MRSKVTVVLLFLNVVLFYYIFQYEQKWRAERAQLETRRRVLGPEAASIEKFTRVSAAAPTVSAEKRNGDWWLTQPLEWPANPNAVARILHELQFLEHETSFAVADLAKGGQSLADYGLAEPALVFNFTSGGRDYTLKLGDRTEIGARLYLLSPDGQRIHVVSRSLADSLGLLQDELRSNSVFTIPVFEVRSLAVQTAPPANLKIRLRREGARWTFETPILARAQKSAVEVAINALNHLTATRFIEPRDADPTRTGLDAPQLRVTLEGNSRRETLLLGAPTGAPTTPAAGESPGNSLVELHARFEDKSAIFTTSLPVALLEALRTAQENLRDPHVLDFETAHVTALSLAAPDQPELDLQRLESTQGAETWQLVVRPGGGQAPQTLPADTEIVRDLLQRLQFLAATRFLSDAPAAADLESWGFNRPERIIALNLSTGGGLRSDEATTQVLQIGARPGERSVAYARLANAPFVYQIQPDLLADVPINALHFRQRLLRELPEGTRITALKLTDLPSGTTLVDKAAPPEGELNTDQIAKDEAPARGTALAQLVRQLRALRAKSFVSASFDPASAEQAGASIPWRYRLELTLTLAGGTSQTATSTLLLTERLGGTTQLAGTEEFGGVTFTVNQDLLDALFALTYAPENDPGPPAPADVPAESPKS